MSPTQRSLQFCRKHGWDPAVTERWNEWAKIRQDLYGFADMLVLDDRPGLLAVQATSGTNAAARMTKLSGVASVVRWLKAGLRAEVWAWRKTVVKRGGKAVRWSLRRVVARLSPAGQVEWTEAGSPLVD